MGVIFVSNICMRLLGPIEQALAGGLKGNQTFFDYSLDGLFCVQNVLFDQLKRPGSIGNLTVELIGKTSLLKHSLLVREARIDVAFFMFENVSSFEFLAVWSLLDFGAQQIAGLGTLKVFALLVESW